MRFGSIGNNGKVFVAVVLALLFMEVVPAGVSPCVSVAQTTKKAASAKKKSKSNAKANQNSKQKQNAKPKASGGSNSKTQGTASRRGNRQRLNRQGNSPKTSAEARRLQEAAQKEIQQTKEKIKLNEQQIKTGLSDLNLLSSEISAGRIQVESLQKKVSSLNAEINKLGNEINKNEEELKLMREEYLKAVKKMRLTKKNQSVLAFIFASENFNQALRRIRYMRQFSAWKERKSSDIKQKVEQLGREKERLSVAKEEQTATLVQLGKSQAELEEKHKKQEKIVAELRQNGNALQAHLVAKQKEANRLKETISALIAQEQARAEAERKAKEEAERKAKAEAERRAKEKKDSEKKVAEGSSGKEKTTGKKKKQEEQTGKTKESGNKQGNKREESKKENERNIDIPFEGSAFASMRGRLPRPVDGLWRITNDFGRHSMPELPEIVYDNPGIDAEVTIDTPVKSVCAGKVSGVYKVAGYGTVVIVNHGEYYTVYGNLSSANVAVGTQVGAGSKVGNAGLDPDDSRRGSVHFEVWKGREKQNPSAWIR